MTQFAEPQATDHDSPTIPRLGIAPISQPVRRKRRTSAADLAAASVRLQNARTCLVRLRDAQAPLTVTDLAELTNLSKPTVVSVLEDLMSYGRVHDWGVAETCLPGRPARRFSFAPATTVVAGVDVGSKVIICHVADANGRVLSRVRRRFKRSRDHDRLTAVASAIEDAVGRARHLVGGPNAADADPDLPPQAPQLAAIGISVPGALAHSGRLVYSLATPDWLELDLETELTRRFGCPVHVENDSKLAAYAEHQMAGDVNDLVYLQIGHRISVALIVNGIRLEGSHRLAGEIGSQRGMRWTKTSHRGELQWSTGAEAKELIHRAGDGDQRAIAELDAFCAEIAPRVAAMLLVVDPEVVVVGGGLSHAGELLLEPLRRHIDQQLMNPEKPELRLAQRPADNAVLGAIGHAFEQSSRAIYGLPDVPPPWAQLTDPGPELKIEFSPSMTNQ